MLQPASQYASLPMRAFNGATDLVDDLGVQADARHQQEHAGWWRRPPNSLCPIEIRCGRHSPRRRAAPRKSPPSFNLHRQHVGGARRQHSQRHLGMRHAFGHFVEGAVAPAARIRIRAARDLFPRQRAAVRGPVVGQHVT